MDKWIYRHYKWWLYEVIYLWINSENLEKEVIYRQLYGSDKFPEWTIWVRLYDNFNSKVIINKKSSPRFTYIWNKNYENI